MRPQRHSKPVMTRAQNLLAYKMWLTGCTDEAIDRADLGSIARSYGLKPDQVASDVAAEIGRRAMRNTQSQRLGEPHIQEDTSWIR